MDVTGLYTNIPHSEGIKVIQDLLQSRPTGSQPSTASLIKLLNCVLKLNNFRFNESHYIQVNGTTMGTRAAPTYANLFMEHIEKTYVYSYKKRPLYWFRFIDDIWGIYRGSTNELIDFFDYMNTVHQSIKFTTSYSEKEIIFLDVITYKSDKGLFTKLYSKPTDSHSYLDFTSCHPYSIKTGIPFSQFLRIRRNCTEWRFFTLHSMELYHHFLRRGYPHNLLLDSIK